MPFIGARPMDGYPWSSAMHNFLGLNGGSSVHTSAAGVLHSGGGGSFADKKSAADSLHDGTFLDDLRKEINPDSPAGPSFYDLTRDRGSGSQPQIADYLDAPWASSYGMSKETAYSEAMENTAYRRSVFDMQKAGLNPAVIFGAGRGSTAGSPSYISSGSSGSSGRVSRRGSGGRSSGKLFSTSAYSVLSALGGIVGAAATKSAGGYWLGMSLSQGAMSALNLLSRR